jgi:tetratricopeptide (TPR) repeat protein
MNAQLSQAEKEHRRDNLSRAAGLYRQVINAEPDNAEAYAGLAGCLCGMKQYAQAFEASDKVLSLKPEMSRPHHVKGWVYMVQGKYPESKEEYQKALTLDPRSIVCYIGLAELYRVGGRPDDAEETMHQALQVDAHNADAYAFLSYLYSKLGKHDKAIQAARQARVYAPNYGSLYGLIWAYILKYRTYHGIAVVISAMLFVAADSPLAWVGSYAVGYLLLGASTIYIQGMRKHALVSIGLLASFIFFRAVIKYHII